MLQDKQRRQQQQQQQQQQSQYLQRSHIQKALDSLKQAEANFWERQGAPSMPMMYEPRIYTADSIGGEIFAIRGQLEELRSQISRLVSKEAFFEKLDELHAKNRALGILRRGMKTPRQLNIMFMDGMTIGDLLQKHIAQEHYLEIPRQLNIPDEEFAELIQDRVLPDKKLTDKLVYIMNKEYGVKYSEFMICKAHTYSKMERFSEIARVKAKIKKKLEGK